VTLYKVAGTRYIVSSVIVTHSVHRTAVIIGISTENDGDP